MRRVVLLSVVVEALADAVAVDKERRSGRSVERNIGDRETEVENVEGVVTGTCQLALIRQGVKGGAHGVGKR